MACVILKLSKCSHVPRLACDSFEVIMMHKEKMNPFVFLHVQNAVSTSITNVSILGSGFFPFLDENLKWVQFLKAWKLQFKQPQLLKMAWKCCLHSFLQRERSPVDFGRVWMTTAAFKEATLLFSADCYLQFSSKETFRNIWRPCSHIGRQASSPEAAHACL